MKRSMCQVWISGFGGDVVIRDLDLPWDYWLGVGTQPSPPSRPQACLPFRYVKSGGAFRRVRLALACRTEPLSAIIILWRGLYKRNQNIFRLLCSGLAGLRGK